MVPAVITDEHLIKVCKYRQGGCCRYIVFFDQVGQFCCVKKDLTAKAKIDDQIDEMKAQGDNCEGLLYEAQETDQRVQGTSTQEKS